MQNTALILGSTGRFGRAAAEAFWNAGWRVRTFDRRSDDLPEAARGAASS
jgi:NAD(P)-dependent dehydrogenase (short-subunit alcohol dehydrogenase family)